MPVHIRLATLADVPGVARVAAAAFHPSTDVVTRNLFPARLQPDDKPEGYYHLAHRTIRKTARLRSPDSVIMVAVDDDTHDKIVDMPSGTDPATRHLRPTSPRRLSRRCRSH